MGGSGDWARTLETWLEPVLVRLGHPARRRMCPLYGAGLIGPGERKSLQPIAARLAPADYDPLHHFIAVGPWDDGPLEAELLAQADRLVGGPDAILVIDDTALPKKGQLSVGVAPQYASALGKNANCQTLVSLTLAQGEVPVPIAWRLFLPETCFCPRPGPTTPNACGARACRTHSNPNAPSPRSPWPNSSGPLRPVFASGPWWRMRAMGSALLFARRSRLWGCCGLSGSRASRRSIRSTCSWCQLLPHGGGRARHSSQIWRRLPLKRWWRMDPGAGSLGGTAPKDPCGPSLRRCACGWRMGLRCVYRAGPASTFLATRSGLWANIASRESTS